MGTLGHVLGGIGAAVGGAMVQRATTEAQQRHEMVLERVRAENRRADMTMQADLNDRNDGRSAQRGDFYDGRRVARTTAATMTIDNNRTVNRENEAQSDFRRSVSMAEIQAHLQTRSANERAAFDRSQQANDIQEYREGADGRLYGFTRTGRRVDMGIAVPPRTQQGTGSLLLDNPTGTGTGARPPSGGPAIGTVEGGFRYKGGDPAVASNWERVP
jgi:hypothetical protein